LESDVIKREFASVFWGVSARIQSASLGAIGRMPGVRRVWRDEKVQAYLDASVPLIRADRVWTDLGVTGKEVLVAIVDTGIDYTHPDLGGCLGPDCKVIGGKSFVNAVESPMDDNGHGTHVAGIVAANGSTKGVAPDARLLAVKVLGSSGGGSSSWVIAGIEYAVDPDGNPTTRDGAQVINLSLGPPTILSHRRWTTRSTRESWFASQPGIAAGVDTKRSGPPASRARLSQWVRATITTDWLLSVRLDQPPIPGRSNPKSWPRGWASPVRSQPGRVRCATPPDIALRTAPAWRLPM
jgi:subtilisin family serine protease